MTQPTPVVVLAVSGMNDVLNSQGYTQAYNSVADTLAGANKVSDSYRLFMVPGMAHCRGGNGTDRFDVIGAMEQWVEKGKAPESLRRVMPVTRWSARARCVRIRRSQCTKGPAAPMTPRTLLVR